MHDRSLLRQFKVRLPVETALIGHAGDQEIWGDHPYALTPHQATRTQPLTDEQPQDNCVLPHPWQWIEPVIRRLKIFRVFEGRLSTSEASGCSAPAPHRGPLQPYRRPLSLTFAAGLFGLSR
jgi:hypothetical protein